MLGDRLKTKMNLFGHPGCINTTKCIFTAAEKGVDIESHFVDPNGGADSEAIRALSPFGAVPVLKDQDFVVYGTQAIMSYLDDKGFGPSLLPRNGVVRAINYQWSYIASDHVQPQVVSLLSGDGNREDIATGFSQLAGQLEVRSPQTRGDYICGNFSLADIHWAAVAHGCDLAGASDLVTANASVEQWWGQVKSHPSTSKEKLCAYEVLPTLTDIQNNVLKDLSINA